MGILSAMLSVGALLEGWIPDGLEKWEEDLLP